MPDEIDEPEAADFEELLKYRDLTGKSSHFMFSSEKKWDEPEIVETPSNYSKYFHLDTKLMNPSILAIPFYERHTFDLDLTEDEKHQMKLEAEANEIKYKELLQKSAASSKASPSKKTPKKQDPVDSIAAGIAKMETKQSEKESSGSKNVTSNKKETMQDWLDGILDI